jgi:hypothetical protein
MKFTLMILALALSGTAGADVEKIAEPTETGIRFMWWPKVEAPKGWQFDEGASHRYAFKAFVPHGSTFSDAEAVIYAKANFKPRTPEVTSVEALVAQDIAGSAEATAERKGVLLSGDGKAFQLVAFVPKNAGDWEYVAYGEEPEYFILFTLSSHTKDGLARALPDFRSLVASYKVGP